MATETFNLKLKKPEMNDKATPEMFNDNFDVLDSEIADMNRYKGMIDTMHIEHTEMVKDVDAALDGETGILAQAMAYTDSCVGAIGGALDAINGEEI